MSGRILGAHQKIDRVARRHLKQLAPHVYFPHIRGILHFEGVKGPDAIKRKSPGKDEPQHFLLPYDADDLTLISHIEQHYAKLVLALKAKDTVRAGFEAAWLAHAVVDGLTPAHHYPYEEALLELRSSDQAPHVKNLFKKLVLPGSSASEQLHNNWKFWGAKGLFTTHYLFEWGVAVLIAPSRLKWKAPTADKLNLFDAQSIGQWYRCARPR